jgi:type IV secretion system protein VirB1
MLLATIVLAQMLRECAAKVDLRTMSAVVSVESAGDRLALHDNTLERSFAPASRDEAVAWTEQLLALGHSVDIGLSQINSRNLPRLGLRVEEAFDPCTNLRAGATILSEDYASASARFGAGQVALRRALGAYNTGSLFAGREYVNRILIAAGFPPEFGGAMPAPAARTTNAISFAGIAVYGSPPSYTARRAPGSSVEVIQFNK